MKPILLLSTRPESAAAEGEVAALRRITGLGTRDLVQIRVEQQPLGEVNLNDYAGIILGGGPFNSSDEEKSPLQLRVEADLNQVLNQVFDTQLPFLGLCYGIGTVTTHLGGRVDRRYGEPVGAIDVTLTPAGEQDPLLQDLREGFRAFVGHKEAVSSLPDQAVLLATGEHCPVQMYRVADHCWVTQFHPELDAEGIKERIRIYRMAGYFAPDEVEQLCAAADTAHVQPRVHTIVTRFVELCAAAH